MNWRKELLDQSAHFVAALTILLPVMLWPSPLTGLLAGWAVGYYRERREGFNPFAPGGLRDMASSTVAGAVAGLAFQLIKG